MHELSVTQSMIQSVLAECKKHDIQNLSKIILELGGFTSYAKDPILFYYDLLRKDIPFLRDVDIEIREVPGKIICKDCNKKQIIEDPCMIFCRNCHSTNVDIIQGKEFIIKNLVLER